jgi:hypothetical protein
MVVGGLLLLAGAMYTPAKRFILKALYAYRS